MNRIWRHWLWLAYPLLAVNVIIALLYAFAWCRAHAWQLREGVLTFIARRTMLGNPGGQGWSPIVGYASEEQRDRKDLRVHENVHVVQETCFALGGVMVTSLVFAGLSWSPLLGLALGGVIGGAAFAVAYGAAFFACWLARGFGPWVDAYRASPFERHAYARQAAYVSMPPSKQIEIWGHR